MRRDSFSTILCNISANNFLFCVSDAVTAVLEVEMNEVLVNEAVVMQ